ncbi:MAG: GNAT family N-acetyltransferase [Microscillaceae bacterium]|jgi:ribosomal-protein-alanine N-acetyltransferase|nr:GNAT family N-acetyltransferase [Microscillaceae bacterium]
MEIDLLFGSFPRLATPRLLLHEITQQDWQAILFFYQNEVLRQYNAWAKIETAQQARQKIRQFAQEFQQHKKVRWGIYAKANQQLLGNCVLYNLNLDTNQAEIGFNLLPIYQQQGFMTEALSIILDFLYQNIHLTRLEAWVMSHNLPSKNFLTKLGFLPSYQTLKSKLSGEDYQEFIVYEKLRD